MTNEMVDSKLVLHVVLVEQRALQQVEVAVIRRYGRVGSVEEIVMGRQRLESDRLAELEQFTAARRAFQPVQPFDELGPCVEQLLVSDDGQTEIDGDQYETDRPVVLGEEVVERGHDPVV